MGTRSNDTSSLIFSVYFSCLTAGFLSSAAVSPVRAATMPVRTARKIIIAGYECWNRGRIVIHSWLEDVVMNPRVVIAIVVLLTSPVVQASRLQDSRRDACTTAEPLRF